MQQKVKLRNLSETKLWQKGELYKVTKKALYWPFGKSDNFIKHIPVGEYLLFLGCETYMDSFIHNEDYIIEPSGDILFSEKAEEEQILKDYLDNQYDTTIRTKYSTKIKMYFLYKREVVVLSFAAPATAFEILLKV